MLLASSPSRINDLKVESYQNGTAAISWKPSPEIGVTGYIVAYGPGGQPRVAADDGQESGGHRESASRIDRVGQGRECKGTRGLGLGASQNPLERSRPATAVILHDVAHASRGDLDDRIPLVFPARRLKHPVCPVFHAQQAERQHVRHAFAIAVGDLRHEIRSRPRTARVRVHPTADERFQSTIIVFRLRGIFLHRFDVGETRSRLLERLNCTRTRAPEPPHVAIRARRDASNRRSSAVVARPSVRRRATSSCKVAAISRHAADRLLTTGIGSTFTSPVTASPSFGNGSSKGVGSGVAGRDAGAQSEPSLAAGHDDSRCDWRYPHRLALPDWPERPTPPPSHRPTISSALRRASPAVPDCVCRWAKERTSRHRKRQRGR